MTVAALKHNSEDLWFMPGAIVEKYKEEYEKRWSTIAEEFIKRFVLRKDPHTAQFDVYMITKR
ncbi:hypothetical protein PI124_g13149 [Phytophthora idaei]|nr:hypothetical protein PI124_g13149 [Phytophthora idaei]